MTNAWQRNCYASQHGFRLNKNDRLYVLGSYYNNDKKVSGSDSIQTLADVEMRDAIIRYTE
jgi:hypothetical protein